jgi:enolase
VHERPSIPEGTCTETALCRAAIPSGASAGIYKALELRDKDKDHPIGKGVLETVAMLNDITAPKLIGVDVTDEFMILPTGAASFKDAMTMGAEVYHTLKRVIKKRYGPMRAISVTKEALLRACRTTLRQWMCPWTQSRSPGLQERSRLEPTSLRQGSGKDHPIGRNVLNTVANLNDITAPKLIGVDVIDLVGVDKLMVDELIEVIRM